MTRGFSFLAQLIWWSIDFMHIYGHLFIYVREIFFYRLFEHVFGSFELGIFAPFYPIKFGLFSVSLISWLFWVSSICLFVCLFVWFKFYLTIVSICSKVSSTPEILSSIFCIPLVILTSVFLFFFFPFFIRYLAHLHFQCYTKSPPYPPTPTPLPTHSPFLALAFPCTGAYKVCVSNGPLFAVMAD